MEALAALLLPHTTVAHQQHGTESEYANQHSHMHHWCHARDWIAFLLTSRAFLTFRVPLAEGQLSSAEHCSAQLVRMTTDAPTLTLSLPNTIPLTVMLARVSDTIPCTFGVNAVYHHDGRWRGCCRTPLWATCITPQSPGMLTSTLSRAQGVMPLTGCHFVGLHHTHSTFDCHRIRPGQQKSKSTGKQAKHSRRP